MNIITSQHKIFPFEIHDAVKVYRSFGWPRTHSDLFTSAFLVTELQMYASMPGYKGKYFDTVF